jgi:hypothetical protein
MFANLPSFLDDAEVVARIALVRRPKKPSSSEGAHPVLNKGVACWDLTSISKV